MSREAHRGLEQLRALMYERPSAELWQSVWDLFESWPRNSGLEVGLDYAQEHLLSWPDALRSAPSRWVDHCLMPALCAPGTLTPPPAWALVRALQFTGPVDDLMAQRVAASSLFCGLTDLSFADTKLSDVGVAFISGSPHLHALRSLDLGRNPLTFKAARAISASEPMSRLEALNLQSTYIGSKGLQFLVHAPSAVALRSLDISSTGQRDNGARELGAAPMLRNLRSLDMSRNLVSNEGTIALADSPHLNRLVDLDLSHNRVQDTGALALAQTPFLRSLSTLNLEGNNIQASSKNILLERYIL